MTDKDCPHGQQPSTCYRCELERENARLRAADQARMGDRWNLEARVAELEAAVREAASTLRNDLYAKRVSNALAILEEALARAALGEE